MCDVLTVKVNTSIGRLHMASYHVKRGRLSGTIGPYKSSNSFWFNSKVKAADRCQTVKFFY